MLKIIKKYFFREIYIFIFMSVILIISAIIAYVILDGNQSNCSPKTIETVKLLDEPKDSVSLAIALISFVLSILAFYISTRTFVSIDGVNMISRMEGNILENENYVTPIHDLLNEYNDKNADNVQKKILSTIMNKLKKDSKTAIMFADTLQYMIDVIIFFPAILHTEESDSNELSNTLKKIINKAEENVNYFPNISSGNLILLKETINLFKGVITFQEFDNSNKYAFYTDLLKVRGSLLRNPVTKTVYHDYMGLYYHKKAMSIMLKEDTPDQFSLQGIDKTIKNLIALKKKKDNFSKLTDIKHYLEYAKEQFDLALKSSQNDLMWSSFINFNIAQTSFYLSLIENEKSIKWIEILNKTIKIREHLVNTINDIFFNQQNTLLQKSFHFEEELVRLVKVNLLLSINKFNKELNINEQDNALIQIEIDKSNISNLCEEIPLDNEFKKLKNYKEQIKAFLKIKSEEIIV